MAVSGAHGMWQAFMRSAVTRGLSVTETLTAGRAAGLATYRRTTMLSDYRAWTGTVAKAERFKYIPKAYRASQALYTENKGFMQSRFRYQVNFTYRSGATGEVITMHQGLSSDMQLTLSEIESEAIDRLKPRMSETGGEIISYRTIGGFHKEGELWD